MKCECCGQEIEEQEEKIVKPWVLKYRCQNGETKIKKMKNLPKRGFIYCDDDKISYPYEIID
jgi:hypothetical protein